MAQMDIVDGRYQLTLNKGQTATLDIANKMSDKDVKIIAGGASTTKTYLHKIYIEFGKTNDSNYDGRFDVIWFSLITTDSTSYNTADKLRTALSNIGAISSTIDTTQLNCYGRYVYNTTYGRLAIESVDFQNYSGNIIVRMYAKDYSNSVSQVSAQLSKATITDKVKEL